MAQGTIKDYSTEERAGTLLLDDRTEVEFDAESLEGSGILVLRVGQRVDFELADEGGRRVARRLQLITFS